jgi:Tfp pilus assembly protein FimT
MSILHLDRARAGTTLLEVTIVLVVLGVLTSLAMPRYADASRSLRVAHAANVVAADLELAAALAAQRNAPVDLVLTSGTPGYTLSARLTGQVVLRRTLGGDSEWKLASVAASPATVSVYPDGRFSAALRMVLADAGHRRTITVSRAGLVRVLP